MSLLTRIAASLVLAAVSLPVPAVEQSVERAERLTDLMVEMVPIGKIFDGVAAADPSWPGQGMLDQLTAGQLVCLRRELSSSGYRKYTHARVTDYVAANASRIDGDIALLEEGAAEMFGKLIMAGAEGERTGVEVDPETVLADGTPEELDAFMTFFGDGHYAPLRELAGLGDKLGTQATAEENNKAGEQQGQALALAMMSVAMDVCDVLAPEAD